MTKKRNTKKASILPRIVFVCKTGNSSLKKAKMSARLFSEMPEKSDRVKFVLDILTFYAKRNVAGNPVENLPSDSNVEVFLREVYAILNRGPIQELSEFICSFLDDAKEIDDRIVIFAEVHGNMALCLPFCPYIQSKKLKIF